ncbi:MAG: bifunctional UDP-N-acetylglucosamine diphosphorylase/glucosamine-1-phosphate N-acetyltransferase GlmU [Thermodesulfobacteriota bacterium]
MINQNMGISVIVLAAGKGKRMRSSLPKILHSILGQPIISYILESIKVISPQNTILVLGHGSNEVKKSLNYEQIDCVIQKKQLGTGHAVYTTRRKLRNFNGTIVIINGDSPLISPGTLKKFINSHEKTNSMLSILTADVRNPHGYGRVIRNSMGQVVRIIEEKDANANQTNINEINSGVYCVESRFLWKALGQIDRSNDQKELYLTDIVEIASKGGKKVNVIVSKDSEEILGINNRVELSRVEEIIRKRINNKHMMSGVTIVKPEQTYISPQAYISSDTIIFPNSFIYGNTKIGKGCKIGPMVWIEDSKIGKNTYIKFSSYITDAEIGNNVTIGPFANIRPDSIILEGVRLGNFVEVKKSRIGRLTKVPHLSYIGDAKIGDRVNIGAGTITCNYDGISKHETIIDDDVFIGSDTMLVAPVKIGRGATTGAGSTITKDVEDGALAIERAEQMTIRNWKRKPRGKKGK